VSSDVVSRQRTTLWFVCPSCGFVCAFLRTLCVNLCVFARRSSVRVVVACVWVCLFVCLFCFVLFCFYANRRRARGRPRVRARVRGGLGNMNRRARTVVSTTGIAAAVVVAVTIVVATVVARIEASTVAGVGVDDDDDVRIRVATFVPCGEDPVWMSNRARDGSVAQCFVGEIVGDAPRGDDEDDGTTCAVIADTASVWRVRAVAERLDEACWTMDAEANGARAVVRLLSSVRACEIEPYDVFRVEAVYSCRTREGRLFPYSTMLLGEVVALADAAIYLAEAAYNLRNQTSNGDDVAGDEHRAGSFTLYWPSSY